MGEVTTTVFVTGGGEFIGSHLVSRLVQTLGPQSTIWVLSEQAISPSDPRVHVLTGTLQDVTLYRQALAESQTVYYIPPESGSGELFLSTLYTCGKGKHVIVVSNDVQEEALTHSNLTYTIIRPSWIYGRGMPTKWPVAHLVTLAYARHILLRLRLTTPISAIHIDDLCRALSNCLHLDASKGRVFFAATETQPFHKLTMVIHEHITGRNLFQVPIFSLSRLPRMVKKVFPNFAMYRGDAASFQKTLLPEDHTETYAKAVLGVIRDHIVNTGYWLVTGANSGIGYELACRLHAEGKPLLLVDKQLKRMAELKGNRLICADLSTREGVETVIETAKAYPIFVLVNNAGVGFKGDFKEMNQEQLSAMLGVNVMAPVFLTEALLPLIIRHGGTVVNIASSAGHHPLPGMAAYAATKAFILSWSSALWYELRKTCTVITCSPSGTNTAFQIQAGVKNTSRLLSPLDVADQILAAITHKTPFVFVGWKNRLVIFLTAWFPRSVKVKWWGALFARMR